MQTPSKPNTGPCTLNAVEAQFSELLNQQILKACTTGCVKLNVVKILQRACGLGQSGQNQETY
jgi:hypothetical protein